MNSLSVKAKFQIGQFRSLKQIFYKFEGQFDLERLRSRSTLSKLDWDITMLDKESKLEGKVKSGSMFNS